MRFVRVTAQTKARKEFTTELKRVLGKFDAGHVNAASIMNHIEDAQDLYDEDSERAWTILHNADLMINF